MKFKITESKKSAIWSLVYRVAVNHTIGRDEFFDRMEKYLACDDTGEPLVIEREDGTPFQVECGECEGIGSHEADTGDGRSDNELITEPCDVCYGSGVVQFEQND